MSTETILPTLDIFKVAQQHKGDPCAFARAIEQAVLQSSEVQAWKRDAERLDWLADPNNSIGNVQLPTE